MSDMKERAMTGLRWLVPGLGIKRWMLLVVLGAALFVDGLDRWVVALGIDLHVNEVIDDVVADFFPPTHLAWIFVVLGLACMYFGAIAVLRAVARASASGGQNRIVDTLAEMRLRQGYKIVAIGGGTGLSTLLRGLKRHTTNLTAVVTVSDDGGSSGRLQKELGVLPPGDIRNCLVALSDDEALVTDLFQYRFTEGEGLIGHSFGNLFLAAMTGITGNFDRAIKESSRVLNVKGRVLPSTLGAVKLRARLDDGTIVEGETSISASTHRIRRVFFDTPDAQPLEEVIDAIRSADAIVLGPGSLFTSILPNFLVARIAHEVAAAAAVKIYVCNVMTQPGETDAMPASEHVAALIENAGERVCDYVIVNDEPPHRLLDYYAEEGQVPVVPDIDRITELGMTPIRAQVMSEVEKVRHDPERLANVIVSTIDRTVAERATFVRPPHAYERPARA